MRISTKNQTKAKFKINHNLFLNPRYYRMFALGCFAFLLAFVASAILTPVSSSSAINPAGSTIDISNSINGYYLRFSASDTLPVSISATPASTLKAKTDTLNVVTNVNTGYKLSLSVQDMSGNASNNIYNTADIDKVSNHFSPVNSTYPNTTTLSANTWGFSLANDIGEVPSPATEWSAVPTDPVTIISSTSPTPDSGDNIPITYGFSADTTLPAGSYQATILYTIYAENAEEFPYMQDFTTDQCNNMQTNEITTLTDNRDGKSYRITKYADNNCWMSQNLALDPVDSNGNGITLTTKNTNISMLEIPSGSYTFPNDTVITSGTQSTADKPQAYTADQNKTTTNCGSFAYCITSNEKYGNYYNWLSATLGTGTTSVTSGTVYSSVCPKGWRLPDSGNNTNYGVNAPDKSYGKLMYSVLGFTPEYASGTTGGTYIKAVQQSPLFFPLAGHYATSSPDYHGTRGRYWSRTAQSGSDSYGLYFYANNGDFYPQYNYGKRYGLSVRCVFEGAIEDNMKMQDITIDMCNNLDESTATADNRKTLIDARDNKTYRVSKLADGNCWMVQNLALDPIDDDGNNRTLTTNDTNIDTTEIPSGEITFPAGTDITDDESKYNTPQIYTLDQDKTTATCQYDSCIPSDEPYGNYYNWNAATAMQGKQATASGTIIKSSVCPKGWRLPDNGTATGAKTYSNLVGKYTVNIDGAGDQMPATNVESAAAVKRVQQAPFYFSLAGRYNSGMDYQGIVGGYWSRVVSDVLNDAYNFYFYSGDNYFYPQYNVYKFFGRSVRCVLSE